MRHPTTSSPAVPETLWRVLEQGLGTGERVTLPMLTGSMAPLIPAGSHVEVAGLAPDAHLTAGDVVVFREGSRLVAHRLLFACPAPAPGWYLQRGDGVSRAGLIGHRAVRGLVVGVVGASGQHQDLRTPGARHHGRRLARRNLYRLALAPLRRKDPA